MNFLSPLFFWSFLSLIPLALIYLLKVRPRRKPTTAYFLWEEIFQERRPNRLLERLRDFWSLILMALAFCAVCLALTRPEVGDGERKDVLILIDNSASMSTVANAESRLQSAKNVAVDILRAFNGNQRAAIASVANEVVYQSHVSDNPRELIDAVNAIEPTSFEFRANQFSDPSRDAETSDESSTKESSTKESSTEESSTEDESKTDAIDWLEGQRVVLITDGCFDASDLPERVEVMKVGESLTNVGLVSADLRRLPGASDRLGLYVQLHSTYSQTQNVDLLVYEGTEETSLFRLIPLEVEPGLNEPMTFSLENATPGAWRIRLDAEEATQADALAGDNIAHLSVPKYDPIRVQVATENRFFFENSVLAFSSGSGLLNLVTESPDIVIDQGSWSNVDRAIVFQPQGESKWWSDLGDDLEVIVPKVQLEDHPIIRHLEVSSMSFDGAVQLTAPEKAQVLVASEDGVPLIYRVTENGQTVIVLNLDPVASNFYFSAWFPVLVHGSATHLAGREEELFASYRPGDSIPIVGSSDDVATQVILPNAAEIETASDRVERIDQVGYYQLKNPSGAWTVASSLLSKQESNVDNQATTDTSQPIQRGWPLSHLLTVLAVIVLGVESMLYHQRKVG